MKFLTRQRKMPQVMIVSLIDIFAILLIFVIATATFDKKKANPAVTISLPESKSAVTAETKNEPVVLSISKDKQLYLDNKLVTFEELKSGIEALVKGDAKRTLALNADEDAPYGFIIRVLDTLREAGVQGNLAAFMKEKK